MPELRKDPVVGRWIIMATERARRPGNIVEASGNAASLNGKDQCPFCHSTEKHVCEKKSSKAQSRVVVFPFTKSFFSTKEKFSLKHNGLYESANVFGSHEVVVETAEHIENMADLSVAQIALVLETYAERLDVFKNIDGCHYALIYKNFGNLAGGRKVQHARSHIIASAVEPFGLKEKLSTAREYFSAKGSCLYCDLIAQEIKDGKRVVAESKNFVVLTPYAGRFLFELNIYPKKHAPHFEEEMTPEVADDLASMLKLILMKFKVGLDNPSYNFVIQTAPLCKKGESHDFYHWRMELAPRLTQTAGFEKGTDFFINSIPPEYTAQYLREVKLDG